MSKIANFSMSKEVLLEKIKETMKIEDIETRHMVLDGLLLLYINDKDIAAAFNEIDKDFCSMD